MDYFRTCGHMVSKVSRVYLRCTECERFWLMDFFSCSSVACSLACTSPGCPLTAAAHRNARDKCYHSALLFSSLSRSTVPLCLLAFSIARRTPNIIPALAVALTGILSSLFLPNSRDVVLFEGRVRPCCIHSTFRGAMHDALPPYHGLPLLPLPLPRHSLPSLIAPPYHRRAFALAPLPRESLHCSTARVARHATSRTITL